jgi:hypothetical protein
MKTDMHVWSYVAEFFLEWEMLQTEVVEKKNFYFLFKLFRNNQQDATMSSHSAMTAAGNYRRM